MTHKERLVFITISSELGGAERSLIDLVEYAQHHSSYKPLVILPRSGPLEDQLNLRKIEHHTIRIPMAYESVSRKNISSFFKFAVTGIPTYIHYYLKVHFYLKKINPHSVHSTGIKNHILCCLLSLHTSFHFYIHLRDYIQSFSLIFFLKLFKKSKNIHWMAASHAIIKNFSWPIPVYYDGLNETVFFKNKTDSLKTSLGIDPNKKLIGHAAALAPWKGQRIFIEAANELLKSYPDLHFVIIGSTIYKTKQSINYEQNLKDLVHNMNLSNKVHFVPFINNSREIYDGIDVFVHSSIEPEPFGRVVIESLFCETPTVAAKAGGVLEILNTAAGAELLHAPNDKKSLSCAIEKALSLKSKDLKTLGDNIRARFQYSSCYKRQVDYLNRSL